MDQFILPATLPDLSAQITLSSLGTITAYSGFGNLYMGQLTTTKERVAVKQIRVNNDTRRVRTDCFYAGNQMIMMTAEDITR